MAAKKFIQVGCGGFGSHWLGAVWPRLIEAGMAEAVACVDINTETFKHAKKQLNIPESQCYVELSKAFAEHDDADFAVIVVPPAYHESVVNMALEYDMNIF